MFPNEWLECCKEGFDVFLSHQIGSFLGVWLGGFLYDRLGSYDLVWWLGVGMGIFAAIVHWPIQERPAPRPAMA